MPVFSRSLILIPGTAAVLGSVEFTAAQEAHQRDTSSSDLDTGEYIRSEFPSFGDQGEEPVLLPVDLETKVVACNAGAEIECVADLNACHQSWVGSTKPWTSPSGEQCLMDYSVEVSAIVDVGDIPSHESRRRLASADARSVSYCGSGHEVCQDMHDCMYDSIAKCMKSKGVPVEYMDATKGLLSCMVKSEGCEDPARFPVGVVMGVLLAVFVALVAACAYKVFRSSGARKSGREQLLAQQTQRSPAPTSWVSPELAETAGGPSTLDEMLG